MSAGHCGNCGAAWSDTNPCVCVIEARAVLADAGGVSNLGRFALLVGKGGVHPKAARNIVRDISEAEEAVAAAAAKADG